jgi:hypothetical protein
VMSVWDCDQLVPDSFTNRVRGMCPVLESVRRTSGAARGDRDLRVQQIERKVGRGRGRSCGLRGRFIRRRTGSCGSMTRRRGPDAVWRAVARRQAPVRTFSPVDGGGLLEGLLPAPILPRNQQRARRAARRDTAAVPGGPAPCLPRAREIGDGGEPADAEGTAPPAPEDAAGRVPGEVAGGGELRPGPARGHLARRWRLEDRRVVRPPPGRPAPAGERGLRRVP